MFVIISVARTCGLIFIILDVLKPLQHKMLIEKELEGFGIRLNKPPPNIGFRKKEKGGINLQTLVSIVINISGTQCMNVKLEHYVKLHCYDVFIISVTLTIYDNMYCNMKICYF